MDLKSHDMFNHLVSHLHLAYVEVDCDLRVIEWNTTAENIWTLEKSQACGKKLSELVLQDGEREVFDGYLKILLEKSRNASDILSHVNKEGHTIFCEWCFSPLYDTSGHIAGISMVVQDITAHGDEENELESLKQTGLMEIFKTAPIGMYLAKMDGTLVQVNPELAWMLGYESDETLKKELKGLDHQFFADDKQRREFFFHVMEAETVSHFKAQLLRKDGSRLWTVSHAHITHNALGRPNGFYGFVIDISSAVRAEDVMKKAKELAESATRAKSEFLANMSHEIRTPLNAVIGFTNLVLKTDLDEKQRDYITKVGVAGRALLGIINDILDFSKIEAGKLELESTEFTLYDVLNNLSDMFANTVVDKKIELIISASPSVPARLKGDPLRLGQILINLINNAIKFTQKGEVVVWVSLVEKTGDKARLKFSVSDTGIGMTAEQQIRLFESFSQADTSTTRKFGGTGLGLSISKRLAELMGGKIWVKSEAAMGSTFVFTVDVLVPEGDARKIEVPERLDGLRILVQDENPATREVIMMMLICFSFRVRALASVFETLAELERAKNDGDPYEMVIINWQHGRKGELKSTGAIREWERKNSESLEAVFRKRSAGQNVVRKMPVIITLNFGQEEQRQIAEREGATAFVFKPIKQTQLMNTIVKSYGSVPMYCIDLAGQDLIGEDIQSILRGSLVLLVDDNEINREVATETMKHQGITVETAKNGRQAVDMVKAKGREKQGDGSVIQPYDAVLMDLQMPEMDGYQASELIRAWEMTMDEVGEKVKSMPIIAMSAHALSSEIDRCKAAGMDDYVSKPIEPVILFTQLAKWINPVKRRAVETPAAVQVHGEKTAGKPVGTLSLEGIDVGSGLSKIAGNKDLYIKLLLKFFNSNQTCHDDISKALAASDFESIRQIAHTIKGVSGNLGMNTLCLSSGRLEKSAKESRKDLVEKSFTLFSSDLKTVFTSIEVMGASMHVDNGRAEGDYDDSQCDVDQAVQSLERVLALINDDVAEARTGLAQLKNELAVTSFYPDLVIIENALDDFEMDQAEQALVILLNRMRKNTKAENPVESETKKQKVLVVDDVAENIDVLMELLKTDYRMVGARSGEKALEIARSKQEPDLILLDINMPGMDGFEVCRRLKDDDETKDIPVIFITAETDVADQAKGFELGAVDYITKPIVPVIVKMRVKTQLVIKTQKDLLSKLSTVDGLTQIANRRRFDDILERDWHRCMRSNAYLSLVLMDIDHFKLFNDHYGHQAGDDCLRKVAEAMVKGCMRETDLVARYGGEEFVAVLPDTDHDGALVVADRMRNFVSSLDIPHAHSSAAAYVTMSQGVVSMIPRKHMTVKQFIENADQCLYEAKDSGRNRAVYRIITS